MALPRNACCRDALGKQRGVCHAGLRQLSKLERLQRLNLTFGFEDCTDDGLSAALATMKGISATASRHLTVAAEFRMATSQAPCRHGRWSQFVPQRQEYSGYSLEQALKSSRSHPGNG